MTVNGLSFQVRYCGVSSHILRFIWHHSIIRFRRAVDDECRCIFCAAGRILHYARVVPLMICAHGVDGEDGSTRAERHRRDVSLKARVHSLAAERP